MFQGLSFIDNQQYTPASLLLLYEVLLYQVAQRCLVHTCSIDIISIGHGTQQFFCPVVGDGDAPCNHPVDVDFFEEGFYQQCFASARSTGHHDKTFALIKGVFKVFHGTFIAGMAKTELRVRCQPEGIAT